MRKLNILGVASLSLLSGVVILTSCSKISEVEENVPSYLEFKLVDDSYEVYCNSSDVTDVKIPSKYQGKDVTTIGEYAFANCSNLKSVTMPDSIEEIDDYAFKNCFKLEDVSLSNNIKTIDYSSFSDCNLNYTEYEDSFYLGNDTNPYVALIESKTKDEKPVIHSNTKLIGEMAFFSCYQPDILNIPEGVVSICDNAFTGCTNIKELTLPNSLERIGDGAFHLDVETLKCNEKNNGYYIGNDTNKYLALVNVKKGASSFEFDSSCRFIMDGAFSGCNNIEEINVPNNVKFIGKKAFRNCDRLSNVTLPEGIKSLYETFGYECMLDNISIPSSVEYINEEFGDFVDLKFNEYDNAYYLGNSSNPYLLLVKAKSKDITTCNINSNTKIIQKLAFNECNSLKSITIPESVEIIEDYAFEACINLKTVDLNEGLRKIGSRAFYYCNSITNIELPDSVCQIDSSAFSCCENITSVKLPSQIRCISESLFESCSNLESVTMPSYVSTIGKNAFRNCKKLKSISIPNGIRDIGEFAFDGDTNLEFNEYNGGLYLGNDTNKYLALAKTNENIESSFKINEATEFVLTNAFENNTTIESITIPESVMEIQSVAFLGCTKLNNVVIPETVLIIGDYLFANCTSLSNVTIECGVTDLPDNMFDGCTSLKTFIIPSSVESLGQTFVNSGIETLVIGDNIKSISNNSFGNCTNLKSLTVSNTITFIGYYAFYKCDNLKEIVYQGTMEEFNKVRKDYDAFKNSSVEKIICSDGEITIDESERTLVYRKY